MGANGEDSSATGVNGNQDDNSDFNRGAVHVFARRGTNWSQQAYLKPDSRGRYRFAGRAAISGHNIVVGHPTEGNFCGAFVFAGLGSGVVDIDEDGIADEWEQAHFTNLTNVAYRTDWDGDGFWDGFEFHAGTSPIDPDSFLGVTSVELNMAGTEAVIRWSSESNKLYTVYGVSELIGGLNEPLAERLPATPPENVYTDTVDRVELRTYGVEVER